VDLPHQTRTRRPVAAVAAVLALASMIAACATTPAPTASPVSVTPTVAPSASPTAARLLLRITSEGGFVGPAANLATVPIVSVYADGRVLTPGAVDAIYPGPLLPPVAIKDVGPAGAETIVAAIRAAGLDKTGAGGGIGNPDAATTVITVSLDGAPVTSRFHFGGGPGGPGLPGGAGSPDPSVAVAEALYTRLTDPSETWGGANPRISTLVPTAYRVFVAPGAPAGDGSSPAPAVAWPLPAPLATFGAAAVPDRGIPGLRQGAVFGQDASTLGPVLAAANQLTAFSSGGTLYTVYVRPLLPDEAPAPG
jgi:hypothetical protein